MKISFVIFINCFTVVISNSQSILIMSLIIADICHILTLQNQTEASTRSKSKQVIPTHGSRQLRSSSSTIINKNFSSKQVNRKKQPFYEIVDNKKFVLHNSSGGASSFLFSEVHESDKKLDFVCDKIISTKKSASRRSEGRKMNKLIIAHNYEKQESFEIIQTLGKRLIFEGLQFQLITKSQLDQSMQKLKARAKSNRQNEAKPELQFVSKKVKFVSDLREALNQIKCRNQQLSKLWLIGSTLRLGISFCRNYRYGLSAQTINDLIKQPQMQAAPYYYVYISSLLNVPPNESNYGICKQLLEESKLLYSEIKDYAVDQKEQISIQSQSPRQPLSTFAQNSQRITNLREDVIKTRKNSKNQNCIVKVSSKYQNVKPIKRDESSFEQGFPQQNISQVYLSNRHSKIKQNNEIPVIMAQNIHLKWQLQSIQKQYELQSLKFVEKTNKKYEVLKEEKVFCLQQNGRLRKQNDLLLGQIAALKRQLEEIRLKQKLDQNKNRETQQRMQDEKMHNIQQVSDQKIKSLQQELNGLKSAKQRLASELIQMKEKLQDSRKRSRERIEELNHEVNRYKCFSEQLKVAFDQMQSQARLNKTRCQNLQQRCKKYQQSLSNLLKMKIASPVQKGNDNQDSAVKDARNFEVSLSQEFNTSLKSQRSASLSFEQRRRIKKAIKEDFDEPRRQENNLHVNDRGRQQVKKVKFNNGAKQGRQSIKS